jgi:hypothetical protein
MKRDCFYKLTITKLQPQKGSYYFEKREDVWHVGYFTYREVLNTVEEWYERGADAVELEMISKDQFDRLLPSPF